MSVCSALISLWLAYFTHWSLVCRIPLSGISTKHTKLNSIDLNSNGFYCHDIFNTLLAKASNILTKHSDKTQKTVTWIFLGDYTNYIYSISCVSVFVFVCVNLWVCVIHMSPSSGAFQVHLPSPVQLPVLLPDKFINNLT